YDASCLVTLPEGRADRDKVVGLGVEVAFLIDTQRQHRQVPRRRTEDRLGVIRYEELRLVAGAQQSVCLLFEQARGATNVRTNLRVSDEVVPLRTLVHLVGV